MAFRKTDFLRGRKVIVPKPEVKEVVEKPQVDEPQVEVQAPQKDLVKPRSIKEFYEMRYKLMLIIPLVMLAAALLQIGIQTAATGDFVNKGITLSGGISFTIYSDRGIDLNAFQEKLSSKYQGNEISVRELTANGRIFGTIIEADIEGSSKELVDQFIQDVHEIYPEPFTKDDYSIEVMGSSLGQSFFRETFTALFIAFLFMGIVVFIMFRTLVPSLAVILAAFSDIVVTLAIFNVLGFKLSTAGVAAFLMLIGYSVDTDILLSTKVLKSKQGDANFRIYEAMKTGLMMNLTTVIALTVALIFTDSEVIGQIMTILLIGLLVDLINTWIQNVSLLRWYLDRK